MTAQEIIENALVSRPDIDKIVWDGTEITVYFMGGRSDPWGRREFDPESETYQWFVRLETRLRLIGAHATTVTQPGV